MWGAELFYPMYHTSQIKFSLAIILDKKKI